MRLPQFDCRSGFDQRVVWAMRVVGVDLKEHVWSSGRRKNHCLLFTFRGDREMAKGVVTDFIKDEFDGVNCRFYAEQTQPSACYVLFDEGRQERYVEGETHASET